MNLHFPAFLLLLYLFSFSPLSLPHHGEFSFNFPLNLILLSALIYSLFHFPILTFFLRFSQMSDVTIVQITVE